VKLSQKLTKEQTAPFFDKWQDLALTISDLHKQRDKQVVEAMEAGIILYKKLLVHCSDTEAITGAKLLVPLNGDERLAFIIGKPGSYAAFRQLDELFSEMKKLIAGRRVQLNKSEKGN
jgi:hypothetical protein